MRCFFAVIHLSLRRYLIMPVQRVPRYELLLRELSKFTPEIHVEFESLKRASEAVAGLASWINEEKRRWEGSEKLRTIINSLKDCPSDVILNNPERRLIRKGKIGSGGKKRKCGSRVDSPSLTLRANTFAFLSGFSY